MIGFNEMSTKPETPKVGVGVVLRREDGAVLLGKRLGSHGAGQWALPGGHLEVGETFDDCCKREVLEETGLKIGRILNIDFASNVSEGLHYVTLYFIAEWDGSQNVVLREPDKCEGWEWCHDIPVPTFGSTRRIVELVRMAGQK